MVEARRGRQRTVHGHEVSVSQTTRVAAGTFPWIPEAVDVPVTTLQVGDRTIRLVDVSGIGPLGHFRKKLNGNTPRTDSLIRGSIGEALTDHDGRIRSARIFRQTRGSLQGPIFGLQSGDPNESTRVSALITLPNSVNLAYIVGRSTYSDYSRAARVLEMAGYRA